MQRSVFMKPKIVYSKATLTVPAELTGYVLLFLVSFLDSPGPCRHLPAFCSATQLKIVLLFLCLPVKACKNKHTAVKDMWSRRWKVIFETEKPKRSLLLLGCSSGHLGIVHSFYSHTQTFATAAAGGHRANCERSPECKLAQFLNIFPRWLFMLNFLDYVNVKWNVLKVLDRHLQISVKLCEAKKPQTESQALKISSSGHWSFI